MVTVLRGNDSALLGKYQLVHQINTRPLEKRIGIHFMSINMIHAVGMGLAAMAFATAVNAADAVNTTVITFDNLPQAAYTDYTQDGVTVDMLNNTGANDSLLIHEGAGSTSGGARHGAYLLSNWSLTVSAETGEALDFDSFYIRSFTTSNNVSADLTAYDENGSILSTLSWQDIDFNGLTIDLNDPLLNGVFNEVSSATLKMYGPRSAGVDDLNVTAFVPVIEPPTAPIPEASTVALMCMGLVVLGGLTALRRNHHHGTRFG